MACARLPASLASLPARSGDLRAWLEAVPIAPASSEGFQEPRGATLLAFESAFERMLRGDYTEAAGELASLGYALTAFHDEGGGTWLLAEEKPPRRGGGTFVLNLEPARDLWLETPHADSDEGTKQQGIEQLVALGARALLINGAHRCASSAPTSCGEAVTQVCGGRLRISDSAHHPSSFFTAAHRALRDTFPSGVAVSLHGMEQQGNEAAIASDGTRVARLSSLSVRLSKALNQYLPSHARAFSCNDPADSGRHRPLCGTSNVQGRIDNGSSDACFRYAPSAKDRFLHLEQGPALRLSGAGKAVSREVVTKALADTVPCSLPGMGLGCAPPSPGCP